MNRRTFLKGLGAVVAAVAMPASTLTPKMDLSFWEDGDVPTMILGLMAERAELDFKELCVP